MPQRSPAAASASRRTCRIWIVGGAGLMVSLSACGPSENRTRAAERPTFPAGRVGEHWVQDERLRAVMGQISQHAARWPAGVPDGTEIAPSAKEHAEASEAFRDAEALADGLAEAAQRIPRSVADHPMSAEDRRGFSAEARRLRGQGRQLREAARGHGVEQMQRTLDRISSTCISCHSQYRDFAGELELKRGGAR